MAGIRHHRTYYYNDNSSADGARASGGASTIGTGIGILWSLLLLLRTSWQTWNI